MADSNDVTVAGFEQAALQALKLLIPLLEKWGAAGLRTLVFERRDNLVLSFDRRKWSATHLGDIKNDYKNPDGTPADILSKWADDGLFVLAQQLPGDVDDKFRDILSPFVTPNVRARLNESSTSDDVAGAVVEEVAALADRLLGAVAG